LRVLAVVVVAFAALAGLVLVLAGRDDAEIAREPPGLDADLGASHTGSAPAEGTPTSGPHQPDLVTRDGRAITNDQLLHAIELGNVVILADTITPPLRRLQREVAGPFDAEIAAAGQAVVLARREGAGPATAVAWRRSLEASSATDPELRRFVEERLGTGVGQ
jgi:hypothetical protein